VKWWARFSWNYLYTFKWEYTMY